MNTVLGWDIGGANIKAAHLTWDAGPAAVRSASRAFEIWRRKEALPEVLEAMSRELPSAEVTAVTMTAELSDVFRTKREGVTFVLEAVSRVAPHPPLVFSTDGTFVDVATAQDRPLAVAASNWAATALLAVRYVSDAILVDVGSTTTDIIPIHTGQLAARGRTDPERLLYGEMVYTGAVRTNVAAILSRVPLWGEQCPIASEYFAVSGDAHLLLGDLDPEDYSCPTPDGRAATETFAAERLARLVCADIEMLDRQEIARIARAIAEAQVQQIAAAISRVASRFPLPPGILVTGVGAFLAEKAAARCGFASRELARLVGMPLGNAGAAVAVAWLLVSPSHKRERELVA